MKKVNLLSKAEMKTVLGGSYSLEGEDDDSFGGTCAWHGGGYAICNITKAEAKAYAAGGGNWCCQSCPSNMNCQ